MIEQERQQVEEIIASLKPSALKYETGRAEKNGMSLFDWIVEKEQKKSAAKDKLNTLESQLAFKTQIKNVDSCKPIPGSQFNIVFLSTIRTGRY